MRALVQTVTLSWRTAVKHPGFTAVIVLSMALGIGLNTAIFTLIDKVVLENLPVRAPDELALFDDGENQGVAMGGQGAHWHSFSYASYTHFRDSSQDGFRVLSGFQKGTTRVSVRRDGGAEAELARVQLVSGNYFEVLEARVVAGRLLTPADDQRESSPTAVLSHYYWARRLNSDPSIVGRTLLLNETAFVVAGVAHPDFHGERVESPPDFWLPLATQPLVMKEDWMASDKVYWLNLMGRLRPGVSLPRAQAIANVQLRQFLANRGGSELTPIRQREIAEAHVELKPGARGISTPRMVYKEPLFVLMGVVALVLLIACANVANLLLARAAARRKEMSVRVALGASKRNLIAQVLMESALMVFTGALAGLGLAVGTVRLMLKVLGVEGGVNAYPNGAVLGFTFVLSVATVLGVALLPVLYAARTDLLTGLKEHAPGRDGRSRGIAFGRLLVPCQVAFSLLLVICATLLLRSLLNLGKQDLGFDGDNVLVAHTDLRLAGYKPPALGALYRRILERLNTVSGVKCASLATYSPMSGYSQSINVAIPGYSPRPGENMRVDLDFVGPKHFMTLGTPVLAGREIGEQDTQGSARVAVVNNAFARAFFVNESPIGRRFSMGPIKDVEIVGVTKDAKYAGLREEVGRMVYLALAQAPGALAFASDIEVRTDGDPRGVAAEVWRALQTIDPRVPVVKVEFLTAQVRGTVIRERLLAHLSGFFAVLAAGLACLGLYGVVNYAAHRRKREFGTRMAMGATRRHILWMIMRETLTLTGMGMLAGIICAVFGGGLLAHQLYGVKSLDIPSFSMAAACLAVLAIVAGIIPARQATSVDPVTVLRHE